MSSWKPLKTLSSYYFRVSCTCSRRTTYRCIVMSGGKKPLDMWGKQPSIRLNSPRNFFLWCRVPSSTSHFVSIPTTSPAYFALKSIVKHICIFSPLLLVFVSLITSLGTTYIQYLNLLPISMVFHFFFFISSALSFVFPGELHAVSQLLSYLLFRIWYHLISHPIIKHVLNTV